MRIVAKNAVVDRMVVINNANFVGLICFEACFFINLLEG